MEKERAIEMLKEAVDEIPHLKTLHYQNDEIRLWLDKVGNILTAGLKPEDYSKYWPVSQALEILKGVHEDNIYQEEYLKKVTNYEVALRSILLKYEVVGMEGKRDKGGEVEMDKREAIELLQQEMAEIALLRELPCDNDSDNQEFKLLRYRVLNIIEAEFGKDSSDYRRIPIMPIETLTFEKTEAERNQEYNKRLDKHETALKSIIEKYEMLGIGAEPSSAREPQGTAELPIFLFNKMEFHPKVIEASRSLFEDGHYAQAILEAFKAVENYIKQKTGLRSYGKNLMAQVFNEEQPRITVTEAGVFNKDVQEGFKFLFMGASLGIRNPKAHENIVQKDPFITLEYLGFASFLLKRIEGWQVNQS